MQERSQAIAGIYKRNGQEDESAEGEDPYRDQEGANPLKQPTKIDVSDGREAYEGYRGEEACDLSALAPSAGAGSRHRRLTGIRSTRVVRVHSKEKNIGQVRM